MRKQIFLQIDIATDAAKRAWDTNPDSVYGALVSILIIIVIALAVALVMLWRSKEAQAEKMMEIIKDATKGFQDINNALTNIKDADLRDTTMITQYVTDAKISIIEHIKFLQERIKNNGG